ncbi:unnamed protein product, partial [Choristocarpus tenellus]
ETPVQALELLSRLRLDKLQPNEFTFNAVIDACANAGEYEAVLALISQMVEEGLNPSVRTYSAALK